MSSRGQAETVGYVLVFSAVVLTVALVTISGQGGLVELRDSQRAAGVQTGFSVLASNTDDVVRGGVPSRGTELDLSGGTITLGDPVTLRVQAADDEVGLDRSVTLRPVVYESPSGARLVYASGAVIIRGRGGGTTMVRQPRMRIDESRTILPVVDTTQGGDTPVAVGGNSRVLVRTERGGNTAIASTEGEVDVRITVESPRAAAWEPYLETEIDSDEGDCDVTGDGVTCTFGTDTASVVVTPVNVSFD